MDVRPRFTGGADPQQPPSCDAGPKIVSMIFIDPPYWPAHGTIFSHLVSDTSVAELHDFAAAAGVTERAFDLDHYDVPERLYAGLVAAGAVPISGKELARRLAKSGLRIKAKHRNKSAGTALQYRWDTLMPGQGPLGAELLSRWNEPHRNYHSATHLLAVLEALDFLSDGATPRAVALAAWFHDAVYAGAPDDEQASANLAQARLNGLISSSEQREVIRLVLLTASHDPLATDDGGTLICDADLAILGSPPQEYGRYVAGVRADFAHVADADFNRGRSAVLSQLLALEPLFRTPKGREHWEDRAKLNLGKELAQLSQYIDAPNATLAP